MRITLITPFVDMAGLRREHLDLREMLTGGDILSARRRPAAKPGEPAADVDAVEIGFRLCARIAGLDIRDIEVMDVRDITVLEAYVVELQLPKAVAATTTPAKP